MAAKYRAYAAERGLDPVEYLIDVYNDPEQDIRIRVDCAKAAACYTASKLRHVEVDAISDANWDGDPSSVPTDALIAHAMKRMPRERLMDFILGPQENESG